MKKNLCIHFLNGFCKKGQNCPFSHDIPNSQFHPKAEHSEIECKFFLKNNCKKPDCTFFHGYCKRLKHIKTISNHKNEINHLLTMDNTKYISSDNKSFYIRISGNDEVYEEKVPEGYNIRKIIYSSNNVICAIQNEKS